MNDTSSQKKDFSKSAETSPARPDSAEVLDLFDYAHLGELIGFIWRAPRRHLFLSLTMLLIGICVTAGAFFLLPRVYTTEAKILTQPSFIIPLLSNPHRAVPVEYESATRAAGELILRHDNLATMVQQIRLADKWKAHRPPILRIKDKIVDALFGPISEADMERAMIGALETKLRVEADENTIRISADWQDPQTTYDIVSAAQSNFLRDRSTRDLEAITDSIRILEEEAKGQNRAVAQALTDVQTRSQRAEEDCLRLLSDALPSPGGSTPAAPRRVIIPAAPATPSVQPKIAKQLQEKREQLRELDEPRQRRLADLKLQLAEMRATYAAAHPSILELEAKIRDASVEPREVTRLKQEINSLMGELESVATSSPRMPRAVVTAPPLSPGAAGSAPTATMLEDCSRVETDDLTTARTTLRTTLEKYDDIMSRIDSARIEFITTEAAFKYRYTIVGRPEVPQKPRSPKTVLVLAAGIAMSLALMIFGPAARDLFSRKLIEPWQARRKLPIAFLGEVKDP